MLSQPRFHKVLSIALVLAVIFSGMPLFGSRASAAIGPIGGTPVLSVTQRVSQEPLLAGQVIYVVKVANTGAQPVTDKGYNLTISNTLPAGLTYQTANPTPTAVTVQIDGTTQLMWDNIADLEVNEEFEVSITAALKPTLIVSDRFINNVTGLVNTAPDNSGAWVQATSQLAAQPQAIDIEMNALQSTADEQATGAGEYPAIPGRQAGPDWPYQYRITVRNNNVGPSQNVLAKVSLPAGVAYLGNVAFSTNPNSASTTPVLTLRPDGALILTWALGTLTVAQYSAPIVITFSAAAPYRFRTSADVAAQNGAYAGPLSGDVIPEDTVLPAGYEATATYLTVPTADGSESTPADDAPAQITAEILTVHKGASPSVVGVGTEVAFSLGFFVSEYYVVSNAVLVDVLPDGMTYVDGSASLVPRSVDVNTSDLGQTTITWDLPVTSTIPGAASAVTFKAKVDATYESPALAGQPIVSGDRLTNQVTASGEWQDVVDATRLGTLTPDTSRATVSTRMPTFDKKVFDPATGQWVSVINAFVGDTLTFRLTFASAADIDAKAIVIRDFLPRGMTYVPGSAAHVVNGSFTDGSGCTTASQAPTQSTLNGLEYLDWQLCTVGRGATWQADIQAKVGPVPNVQPGWIVANFGKMSGQNSFADAYSLRAMANTTYKAPKLVLAKSVSPSSALKAGDVITYTLKVTNQGDAIAYNLVVQDTLPVSLTVANTGGSASPAAASYTTVSGNPSAAEGGILQWSNVASLAPGLAQTYKYAAVIPPGLAAGTSLTNLATVSYNSRGDNQGHPVGFSSVLTDDNTDDAIAYIKGVTLAKSALEEYATIGDTVHWVLTGTVPAGVKGYWPVVEENDLPLGFDYVPNSTVVTNATLDTTNHAANPKDSGDVDLRWFLTSIDNSGSPTNLLFTIRFATLVTGVRGTAKTTAYYPSNGFIENALNTARVGWYDKATGYNNTGFAYDGFETNRIDRRSPAATYTVKIRQPDLSLQKATAQGLVGANELVTYTLIVKNIGNDIAFDMQVKDVFPAGMALLGVDAVQVDYAPGFPELPPRTQVTAASVAGATLAYDIDRLYVGESVTVIYRAQVAATISADLALTNTATVPSYSSKPGNAPDTNGDGLPDERTYAGPTASVVLHTPSGGIQKTVAADELTYGASVVYRLMVPAQPINATLYNVVITDSVDSNLQVINVVNGAANGNQVGASFGSIAPNSQVVVEVTALLPENSPAAPGTLVRNRGWVRYDNGGVKPSNEVVNTVVAPALVVDKQVAQVDVQAGDLVDYSIHVRNVGNGRIEKLVVADALPANMSFEPGSVTVGGQAFADPVDGAWSLPVLLGGAEQVIVFKARVNGAQPGVLYTNLAKASGLGSRGLPVPADNSARFPADIDADDMAAALVYGPLTWEKESTFVAFEDLKNVGWCDWDYNDFIVRLDLEKGLTPDANLAALRIRYTALAHGAAFDHQFLHRLPVFGGGAYALSVFDPQGAVVQQAAGAIGDEPALEIFKRTKVAMPLPVGQTFDTVKYPFSNTIQQQTGTIAGYAAVLQVVLQSAAANPSTALPPLPWDPFLYVYNTKQTVHLVQPGHMDNTQVVNNAFDKGNPMLGFDLPLANVFSADWKWPQEFLGIWRVYPEYVKYATTAGAVSPNWWNPDAAPTNLQYAWHAVDAPLLAADASWADSLYTRYYASPVIADLDNDGKSEIIIGNLVQWRLEVYNSDGSVRSGWPQFLQSEVKAAANVADLDGDGQQEVVVGDTLGNLYAFRPNGQKLAGWPIKVGSDAQASYRILSRPAIADLTGDGLPEVIVALSDGRLYVYGANGAPVPGWPASIGEAADTFGNHVIDSSPVVADLDGDGMPEIVVGAYDKNVYAYHANGVLAWKFATNDVVVGTPAIGELDSTRPGLETVIGSGDRFVYVIDKDGNQVWKRPTGWIVRSSTLLADIDGDGDLEILIGSDDHKVWAWHHDASMVAGWPQTTGGAIASSPVMADVDGDGQADIVVGSDDTKIYAWKADGSLVSGWPMAAGYPVKGAPAVGNLDGDQEFEVVAGNFDGALKYYNMVPVIGADNVIYLPVVSR